MSDTEVESAPSAFLQPGAVIAAAGVAEGMRVADFAAGGGGFFTRAAARAVGEAGVVWAVDSNREILSRVKNLALAEGLPHVEVVHGDVERLGGSTLPEGLFDVVIAANICFTLEHPEGMAAEAWRVLRPGGFVLVVDWGGSFGGLGPHPDHVVRQEDIARLFLQAGFTQEEDVPCGAYHWGFLVRKNMPKDAQ